MTARPARRPVPTIRRAASRLATAPPVWTETYDNKNVGTGKTLTPAGVVNDGNGGPNYNYTYATASAGEIDPTNLTVTAAPNTKPYDGTTSAAATPTITAGSIQTGDTAPAWTETYDTPERGHGQDADTGALAVTDGNGGANYNYSYVPRPDGRDYRPAAPPRSWPRISTPRG